MEEVKIFISYAHDDEKYYKIFKKGIEKLKHTNEPKWSFWDDNEINVGDIWHESIQEQVGECNVAILLVSNAFWSSEYIQKYEFKNFLARKDKEGFIFFPILLRYCDFANCNELSVLQFFKPQGKDYGKPDITNILSYSFLADDDKLEAYRDKYETDCIAALKKVINSRLLNKKDLQDFIPELNSITSRGLPTKNDDSNLLAALSNENILNALSLFQRQIREKDLDEKELTDALDTKNKLYNAIFGKFDSQLETIYKDNLAGAIFDNVLASEQIQKQDIDIIQKFRNNKIYESRDRSLIVSGLTISVLNKFDSKKIHLLIDFLTDFEEEVWQKALVGLLFALMFHGNILSLFPEIKKRLNELKEISCIQNAICSIDRILRHRTFSAKDLYKTEPNVFINRVKLIVGNSIDLTQNELTELQDELNKLPDTSLEGKIMHSLFKKETINKFAEELGEKEKITITVEDFFKIIDFGTYLELFELNPLHFNLTDDLFKSYRNWFLPFKDNEDIRSILASSFSTDKIDVVDFIDTVKNSSISDIDKYYILTHIKEFSNDFIETMHSILLYGSQIGLKNISPSELIITKTIKDLYRFNKLSIITQSNNMFDEKLSIYGQTLLDKIANKITEIKINAKYLYDNSNYAESLNSLQNIPESKYDFEILSLFVDNYISSEKDREAIPYFSKLFDLIEKDDGSIKNVEKVNWYSKARQLYSRLEEKEDDLYFTYLEKEILLKEKNCEESLKDNLDFQTEEKFMDLAYCYWISFVGFWNHAKNLVQCLYCLVKYFNALFLIHDETNMSKLQQNVNENRESINVIFQIFLQSNYNETTKLLNEKCKDIHKELRDKIKKLFDIFKKIYDSYCLNINIIKQNSIVQKHAINLYDTILSSVQNIAERQSCTNIVMLFVIEEKVCEITFAIDEVLNGNEDVVLEKLFLHLYEKRKKEQCEKYTNFFLDNLFVKDENVPSFPDEIIKKSTEDFINIYITTEIDIIKKAANQDDAKGQFKLGFCYYHGNGVDKDPAKAFEWFQKAANQDNANGQKWLGICYHKGHGVDKDHAKAFEWFQKAANQDDADGQYCLGICYHEGHGVDKDHAKAFEWFQKSANQDNADGQYWLGICYHNGHGVDKDPAKAFEWFQKAAEQGNANGQYWLGICYHKGHGVDKDPAKAFEWFQKAVEQGNADAQYWLGTCYYYGNGVEKDYVKAFKLFQKAAEQDDATGYANLSLLLLWSRCRERLRQSV
jgi:TPR repeat protein